MPCIGHLRDLPTGGKCAVIVGSGPTKFDYSDLRYVYDPVFFINRTHELQHHVLQAPKFFVTHHISQFTRVAEHLPTIFIKKMIHEEGLDYAGVMEARLTPLGHYLECECQADDEVLTETFFKRHGWLLDRDICRAYSRSLAGFGSATTAIHLAYLMGCKELVMIGCNPELATIKYDKRIGEGQMMFSPDKVKANNRELPKLLGMKVQFR